jgi:hypothetical protein
MDAHLASTGGFELDQALGTRRPRDQFDKSRPARCLRLPFVSRYKQPLQFAGIQVQLLRGPVHALLPSGIDSQLP